MNLVIGASGELGFQICRELRNRGADVRAFVRKPFHNERATKLREMGVQLIQGDLRNKASFGPALKGVHTIIATASSVPNNYIHEENDILLVDKNGMMDLISAAKEAGGRHFIYTSFSGNISYDFPLRNAKRTVEQHLRNSGIDFTILRPGFFMETWLSASSGFNVAKGEVQIYGTGQQPVSYISLADVAGFAVDSIRNPFARNVILELGGPRAISQLEAVRIFEDRLGSRLAIRHISEEELSWQMSGINEPMQQSIAGLKLALAKGDIIDMRTTLKAFRISMCSLEDYADQDIVEINQF